ncbi:peroxiredoxin family protein [Mucilaginibacter agri]|uniref:Redoxin domain-containing protein n=1 Tax=Mucilaginibacter agri TaxID=2695265 RepID=A0A965ZK39_9SPHI|nr:redoxin domain-containing protein [Mucilaginibacter agri]NCD71106.1 redoxin domain-containing protein [Mucilaginibacter agri]
MKQYFFALFSFIAAASYGQDTVRRPVITHSLSSVRTKMDTTRLVYDEEGNELHFYQYQKLMNTGDYTITTKRASPDDPATKLYLKKLSDIEKREMYDIAKQRMAIKSPLLQEGTELDITPLTRALTAEELANKVIVLIFWNTECAVCTESFGSLNAFLQQIHNPENLVVLAITPEPQEVAAAKLKEKPLHHAQLLSNAGSIAKGYQLYNYPSFIVTDKSRIIRYAISGMGPFVLPSFKEAIKTVLFQ